MFVGWCVEHLGPTVARRESPKSHIHVDSPVCCRYQCSEFVLLADQIALSAPRYQDLVVNDTRCVPSNVHPSFGADLPAPTLLVIAISEFFVKYWWLIFGTIGGGAYFFFQAWRRSEKMQMFMDRLLLKVPIFGVLVEKSVIARWTRTLSTMFAAGVPLVEALDSVGGASGNMLYAQATEKIQQEVSTGTSLTVAMGNANLFPTMVLQMCAIGEESGSLDHMLGKAADFYEAEVDDMVAGLSSLMEPIIIVFLGTIIGGIVVSMYLPIFKLGQVV